MNMSGDVSLGDAQEAGAYVEDLISNGANVVWGVVNDDSEPDQVIITVIATGLEPSEPQIKIAPTMGTLPQSPRFNPGTTPLRTTQTPRPAINTPLSGGAQGTAGVTRTQSAGTTPVSNVQLQRPAQPKGSTQETGAKIPEFLKSSKK